jgi:CBS domain-containing protein
MSRTVKSCGPDANLAVTSGLMMTDDIGILPVVDDDGTVLGVITDRDICIAIGTRNRLPSEITVREVITGNLFACEPNDDIHTALNILKDKKVRRIPVISDEGKLQGILSMNDVVLKAEKLDAKKQTDLSYEDVINTFKAICEHTVQRAATATRERT